MIDRVVEVEDRPHLARLIRDVVEKAAAARPPVVSLENCALCARPNLSALQIVVEFWDRELDKGMGVDLRRCPSCGQTYGYWFWHPVIHGEESEESLWRTTPESVLEYFASRHGTAKLLFRKLSGTWVVSQHTADWYVLEAAAASDLDVLRFWLEQGGSPNAVSGLGETALMKAVGCWAMAEPKGREEVVRLLLDRGADAHARDLKGRSALSLAREWGNREAIVALLLKRGCV